MEFQEILLEINRHIAVLNDDFTALSGDYGRLAIDVAVMKSQIANITWWSRAIIGAFIGLFATQIWQLIIIKKKQ